MIVTAKSLLVGLTVLGFMAGPSAAPLEQTVPPMPESALQPAPPAPPMPTLEIQEPPLVPPSEEVVQEPVPQPLPEPPAPPLTDINPGRFRDAGVTSVIGSAWDADSRPIGGANLHLRSIASGRIVASTTANGAGEFTFTGIDSGTYVTELVDANGNVLAVGEAFSIDPGQTVVTFVRLPERRRRPIFAGGLWGTAAAAAIGAAAGAGITALQPCDCAREASPER